MCPLKVAANVNLNKLPELSLKSNGYANLTKNE